MDYVRLNVEVDAKFRQELKIWAARHNMMLGRFVVQLLDEKLQELNNAQKPKYVEMEMKL